MELFETHHDAPYAQLALRFAQALVAGEFERAADLLSPLAKPLNARALERIYQEMIDYGDGPPTEVGLVTTMEQWPAREPNDSGWAYVAISGDGFSEAVTVIVEQDVSGTMLIRHVEWGRP